MQSSPFPIVIALGSNLGDSLFNLRRAAGLLHDAGVEIVQASRVYWTKPWGVTDQPGFVNAALAVRTPLRPLELLDLCLATEQQMGRQRTRAWGPRTIDLDLLLYGPMSMNHPRLTLPHPGIALRDFVLAPLIDLEIPPHPAVAPNGWSKLLTDLPADQQTILSSKPWKEIET